MKPLRSPKFVAMSRYFEFLLNLYNVLINVNERELALITYNVAFKELGKRRRAQTADSLNSHSFENIKDNLLQAVSLFTKANNARTNFLKTFDRWEPVRSKNIQTVREIVKQIPRDYFKRCVSKVVGECFGVVGGILCIILGVLLLYPPVAAVTVQLAISSSVLSVVGISVVMGTSSTQFVLLNKKLKFMKNLIENGEEEFSGLKSWFTFSEMLMNNIEALIGPELIQEMRKIKKNFFNEVKNIGHGDIDAYNQKFKSMMEECVGKMCDSSYIVNKFDKDIAPFVITLVIVTCFMNKHKHDILDSKLLTRRLFLQKSTANILGLEADQAVTGLVLKGSGAIGRAICAIAARTMAFGKSVVRGISVGIQSVVQPSKEIHTGSKSKYADEVSQVADLLEEELLFLQNVYKEMKLLDVMKR